MFEVKLFNDELNINDAYKKAISEDCGAVSLFVGTTRDKFNDLQVLLDYSRLWLSINQFYPSDRLVNLP